MWYLASRFQVLLLEHESLLRDESFFVCFFLNSIIQLSHRGIRLVRQIVNSLASDFSLVV